MAQQRKKASSASAKSTTAAAAPLVKDVADPPAFFALGAAELRDVIAVTKVVSVVLPLRHLRDKTILHEMVLKKLLHRTFEPSADDFAQQQPAPPPLQPDQKNGSPSAEISGPSPSYAPRSSSSSLADVYVIVHIKAVEVHADTARQVNPQGDVQVNVMTTLVAARVRHGLMAGVAEPSAFANCMQVRLPTVMVSAAVASPVDDRSSTDVTNLASVKLENGSDEVTVQPPDPSGGTVEDRQLRVTARCLEDEPVVPGQAVLLVSEPAAMRCLAIRPPRDAPGPFFFAEDVMVGPTGAAASTKPRRSSRKTAAEGQEGTTETPHDSGAGRRVVVIECDVPETADKGNGFRKRPRS